MDKQHDRDADELRLDGVHTLQELAEALHRLRTRQARQTRKSRLSERDLAKAANMSHGSVNGYLKGLRLPSPDKLDLLVQALGASLDEAKAFADAAERIESNGRRGASAEEVGEQDVQKPPRDRRTRRVLLVSSSVVVTVTTIVVVVFAGRSPTQRYLDLAVKPQPSQTFAGARLDCSPRREWNHHFAGDFLGDVYVHLAADTDRTVTAVVTLNWGNMQWHDRVVVEPGLVSSGRGGTLIGTGKQSSTVTNPDDPNPVLVVTTDVAVCAIFGTASTSPAPVPNSYVRAKGVGWKDLS